MSEIDEALALFGGRAARLVSERENAVYEADLPGGRAAVRLHRPGYQTEAAIHSELDWMRALTSAGVAVPEPLAGPVVLSTGRVATAVAWVAGAPLGEGGTPLGGDLATQTARFRAVGRAVADLHNASDGLRLGAGFTRHAWDAEGLLGEAPLWGRFWESPALNAEERALVDAARDRARGMLEAFAARGGDYGLIHADVLRENVLFHGDKAMLIDFDDAGWGFRLYDLATFMTQNEDEPDAEALRDAALQGYRELRELAPADAARLPLFVLLRRFASMGWIVPRADARDPRVRGYAAKAVAAARGFMARG
ncbi:phosphotransferase enzyme family protein [Maritimibacter sp. HL-12]|uniref:phosphotransferase enzyme family protein n=1 Tax=Maritimibacter sp. HL-12 TaxID=1162418 RepID=UPI000A0F1654|nr:phosphotransferase [Maritimibacter sp. HL-12]SMH41691.1 Ser/Thr protein kinase RdoA involved in Cpx stress response, MazF antagonist [Maritimibacter sp. HL-12]